MIRFPRRAAWAALLSIALACFAASAGAAPAQGPAVIDAYILANEIRGDAQRGARLYLESGLELRAVKTRAKLAATIAKVDMGLERFRKLKVDDPTRKLFAKMDAQWADLRAVLARPYDKPGAELAYLFSEDVSISSTKLCFHLEDAANSEHGTLVDISGRLLGFGERIAKASLYGALTGKRGAEVDFITWKKEYEDGLATLETSRVNGEYQQQNLALARTMWVLFDSLVTGAHRRQAGLRLVDISKSADGMWEIIHSNMRQYEERMRIAIAQKPVGRRPS